MRMKPLLPSTLSLLALALWANAPTRAADEPTPTAKPLVIAFLGVAHIHTGEFVGFVKKRRDDVTVKYVYDADPAKAAKRAKELGAEVADVAKVLADPAVKAVVICSETDRHKELVVAAAKAKKAIYAEKPLGMAAADAYEMAAAIDAAGVPFTTGYFMRSDPKLQFLKTQVKAGAFGTITRIRGTNSHNGALGGWFDRGDAKWMADPKRAGVGAYGDMGAHSLDVLLWLMDEPVERVTAVTNNGTARYPGCDEVGEGMLVFKSGAIGTLAGGWDDVSSPVTLEIAGTAGHATIMADKLYFKSDKVAGSKDDKPLTAGLPPRLPIPIVRWLDTLEGKAAAPLITADEAAYESAVMDGLYKASASKAWEPVQAKP